MSYELGKGNIKEKTEYHSLDSLFGETMHSAKKGEIRPMSTRPQKRLTSIHLYFVTCAVTHLTKRETSDNCNSGNIYNYFH